MYIISTNFAGKVLKGLNYTNIIFPRTLPYHFMYLQFNYDLCEENPFKKRNS
jgi:hypothetical protein